MLDIRKNELKVQKKIIHKTKVPDRLIDYKDLPVFGTAKDLPKPQKLKGPYVCGNSIVLSDNEKKILSKSPKYSILKAPDLIDFTCETEKYLSKHRYQSYENNNNGKKEKTKTDGDLKTMDIDVKDPRLRLDHTWKKEKHRFPYDPFTNEISFQARRPTDYKLKTRVALPKALGGEEEFKCEVRKRSYLNTLFTAFYLFTE